MILLDAPYVSDFLKKTVETLNQPVLDTPCARNFLAVSTADFLTDSDFASRIQSGERVYTNSENSLDLIVKNAGTSHLARQIEICKDKALFRETTAALYPDYQFCRVDPNALDALDYTAFTYPCVIKPTRGFFSLGVHMIFAVDDWTKVNDAIRVEQAALNAEYPSEVVDSAEFILEEAIDGDEYAIDVYYDGNGEPVITNILFHQFASEDDVSDRLYYTSPSIIETWLTPFTEASAKIGQACGFRDFPIHLEVRVTSEGRVIPIEANPLRFAGWCVCDITNHAWGFNQYEYYFNNIRPDWPAILKERTGKIFAMVIGDVPAGMDRQNIASIDYDGFCGQFEQVLELRQIDFTAYPVFAFAFTQAGEENLSSLKSLLGADFGQFITLKA